MASQLPLPPAYSTLPAPTEKVALAEETVINWCNGKDDGAGLLANTSFENKTARIGFMQKVLAMKLLQLLIIGVVMAIFETNDPPLQWYMDRGNNYLHLTLITVLVFAVTVGLQARARRDPQRLSNPLRYVFLVIYPISLAFLITFLAMVWVFVSPVLTAWVNYCGGVFAVLVYSIFALQTKLEFSTKHSFIVAIFVQIVVYGYSILISNSDAMSVLYPTIIFSLEMLYVLWDVEIMTTKDYWTTMTPGHFLDAVLNLHLDYYFIVASAIFPKINGAVGRAGAWN